ncbi:unnamed protein product [Rotaria sordida]|uniref:Ubiquitin-conjugating enzyme E2C-binding protein n=1 Tax=Rotaria sordida TaxID=392033 RepID=A0A814MVR6_9BILA|nr:unnamed protein product [Rotaria sordida]CAF1378325.1 unnamed protein product [Rotaria sordida]
MIQFHIDILQNLQQAIFIFNIPRSADCSIQTEQCVIEDEEQHWQTIIHFNNLIIDVNKGTEVVSPVTTTNATRDGQIHRTFKFPFLRLPVITDNKNYDLNNITCAKCQSPLKIIAENQTYKIVQQQNANVDDINEVMYCHRFCEAHQHDHKHHHHQYQLPVPLDLHSELIVLETIEYFIIAKEYSSSDLIHNELVQCNHCSSCLGSFDTQKNLVSFNKCSLLPFSNDYLSTCFRHCEPGRYIIKVPKSNDSMFLVWILPNQILSGNAIIDSSKNSTQLDFYRMRKVLFTHVTSSDNQIFNEWKRDFSVTTLLVNHFCLDHLSIAFKQTIETFPNTFNSKEPFQSVTISC